MNKTILSLAAALLCSPLAMFAQAQQSNASASIKKLSGNPVTANKTTALDSRLLAVTYSVFSSGNLDLVDSSRCTYNTGFGYDVNTDEWKYTTAHSWDYDGSSFSDAYRSTHSFDGGNRIIKTLNEGYDMSAWVPNDITSYGYNTAGKIAMQVDASYNGTDWDSNRSSLTYNTQGLVTMQIMENWDNTSSSWVKSMRTTNTYNTDGLITVSLSETWNSSTSQWENSYRSTSTYVNKVLTGSLSEMYQSGSWMNGYQVTYTNSPSGKPLTIEDKSWNGGVWQPQSRTTNTYNTADDMITTVRENYMGGSYQFVSKLTNTYNSYHQVTFEHNESWDQLASQFAMQDGDNDVHYYYEEYTNSVKDAAAQNSSMSIFPVPAKDVLHLRATLGKAQPTSVVIVDMSGRMVKQMNLPATAQQDQNIDISNLAPGRYAVTLTSGETRLVKQVSVIK